MSADLELQKAIYERLSADAALAALVGGGIYDNVPAGAAFPYVTLGEAQLADWSTGDSTGCEHRLSFYTYARGDGRKETKAIMDAIIVSLHEAAFDLESHLLINLRLTGSDIAREAAGTIWRGTIRFRAVTEPIET